MNADEVKKKVLFICTHNSARSQMAEGLLNHLYPGHYLAFSAGTTATSVRPEAIQALAEIGIDISRHRSKPSSEFIGTGFDYVITVCDSAKEACPIFPGARAYIHKNFFDPAAIADADERIKIFRQVRDEIKSFIEEHFNPG